MRSIYDTIPTLPVQEDVNWPPFYANDTIAIVASPLCSTKRKVAKVGARPSLNL